MIELIDVVKRYPTRSGSHVVLDRVNLTILPGEKIGVLGQNGAGKSTLIRLMSGAEQPTTGRVRRTMNVSWPLAFGGAFQTALTGLDNIRFICRLYKADYHDVVERVRDFSELGDYLREPLRIYSSGMRARLAFGISLAIDFDCFLIDEVIAVGDDRFQEKCRTELFQKRHDRAMILVSHHFDTIAQHCQRAAVLRSGRLHVFSDVYSARDYYRGSA
jgi:capsular polysaccharide transport system ATP-binding protein